MTKSVLIPTLYLLDSAARRPSLGQRFMAKSRSPVISVSTHQYPANRSASGTPKASASQYAPTIRPSRSSHQLSGRHVRSSASTVQTEPTAMAGGIGSTICWGINSQGRSAQPLVDREKMTAWTQRKKTMPVAIRTPIQAATPAGLGRRGPGLGPNELNATTIHDSESATDRVTRTVATPGVLANGIRSR
jgi:hypothetical protein